MSYSWENDDSTTSTGGSGGYSWEQPKKKKTTTSSGGGVVSVGRFGSVPSSSVDHGGGGITGLVQNFFGGHSGVLPTLESLPSGIDYLARATVTDLIDPSPKNKRLNDWSWLFSDPVGYGKAYYKDPGTFGGKILKPIASGYEEKYLKGHALHNIYEDPLGTALDASLVAGVAGRAALAGTKAAKVGETGRLGRITSSSRTIEYVPPGAKGITTELQWGKTIQGRLIQDQFDQWGTRFPNMTVFGAGKRAAKSQKALNEFRYLRDTPAGRRYQTALRGLNPEEQRAAFAIPGLDRASATPLTDKIRFFEQKLAEAQTPDERAPLQATIKFYSSIPEEMVANPSPQLVQAVKAGRVLAETAAEKQIKAGHYTPEMVEARNYLEHRIDTGARHMGRDPETGEDLGFMGGKPLEQIIAEESTALHGAAPRAEKPIRIQMETRINQLINKGDQSGEIAHFNLNDSADRYVPSEFIPGSLSPEFSDLTRSKLLRHRALEKEMGEAIAEAPTAAARARLQRQLEASRRKFDKFFSQADEEYARLAAQYREELRTGPKKVAEPPLPPKLGVSREFGRAFYMPHHPLAERPGAFLRGTQRLPTGVIKKPDAMMLNQGVAYAAGRIAHNPEVLTTSYMSQMKFLHMEDLKREYVMPLSQELDPELPTGLGAGEKYVRETTAKVPGEVARSEQAMRETLGLTAKDDEMFKQWARAEVFDAPAGRLPAGFHSVQEMTDAGIKRIPRQVAKEWERQFHHTNAFNRLFWDKSMDVWKFMMLGLKPAWAVANTVTNALFYGLRWGGEGAAKNFLKALLTTEKGPVKARQIYKWTIKHPTLRRKWGRIIEENIPGIHEAAFSQSQLLKEKHLGMMAEDWQLSKLRKASMKTEPVLEYGSGFRAVRAMGRANYRFSRAVEDIFRDAATLIEVKKFSKEFGFANKDMEALLKKTGDSEQHAMSMIDHVNRGMGAYNNLGDLERNVIRRYVFPFYSWFKTVTQITAHYAVDYPGRSILLHKLAIMGGNDPESSIGYGPGWFSSLLPLGPAHDGKQDVLAIGPFSPTQTQADLLHAVLGIGTDSEAGGAQNPANLLGPIPTGLITGLANKDTFYGGDYYGPGDKGFGPLPASPITRFAGSFVDSPQTRLRDELQGKPSKIYAHPTGDSPVPGLDQNEFEALLRYMGIPIKHINVDAAKASGG